LATLVSSVTVAAMATSLAVSSVAGAAGPMTGRLFDPLTFATVGSVAVTAEATDGSASFTATSAADGTFRLDVGDAEYLVGIDGTAAGYGTGWLQYVSELQSPVIVTDRATATPFTARELGDIVLTQPIYAGTVVDRSTGAPVAGVGVQLRGPDRVAAAGYTRADGSFGLAAFGSGYTLAIDGSTAGYESGVVGSGANEAFGRPVVADLSLAATLSPGNVGRISLDALAEPPATSRPGRVHGLRLSSSHGGRIRVTFAGPRHGGRPVDYALTCSTGRRGQTVTKIVTASGQTVAGFFRGHSVCKLTSRNAAGRSIAVIQVVRVR
jgi:hypothetical protein